MSEYDLVWVHSINVVSSRSGILHAIISTPLSWERSYIGSPSVMTTLNCP